MIAMHHAAPFEQQLMCMVLALMMHRMCVYVDLGRVLLTIIICLRRVCMSCVISLLPDPQGMWASVQYCVHAEGSERLADVAAE